MEKPFTLRQIFSSLEGTKRRGVFVRCPRYENAHDIGDCLTCSRYGGLHLDAHGPYRLKCASPSSLSQQPVSLCEPGAA
jgi:hypothetical protein